MEFNPIYWSPDKLLSHNKLFNFVVGNRGGGKSFGAKRLAISRFLKTRQQFVYVRRYRNEFDEIKTFFNDIMEFYPGREFDVKGGKFYIDGEQAGYYLPLSVAAKYKSSSYPMVWLIIYDEFIIEKGRMVYLKDEVTLFLDLYETIARTRNVTALFISNAISSINPYFSYFKIAPKKGCKFIKGEEFVAEFYKGEEFTNMKRNTRFGRLIEGTRYGNYAIENEFYQDNDTFIEKMTGTCIPMMYIKYCGILYSVWYGKDTGYIYFNKKKMPNECTVYCVYTDDHRPNYILIKSVRNNPSFSKLRYAYEIGYVRFDSLQSKEAFYEVMQLF